MKVSIVMAVYNGAATLGATMESILAQSMRDFELIVVDDGSTDATPDLLDEFAKRDARVRVLEQPNAGLTHSLIRGCGLARAELIARHDCGDRSHPERLATQLARMSAGVVLSACATRYVAPGGETLYDVQLDGEEIRRSLLKDREPRGIPHHGSAMFRRDAYLEAGGYRAQFRYAQDLDLWIRLAARGAIAISPEVLYEATIDPRAISSVHRREQVQLAKIAVALRDGGNARRLLDEASRITKKKRRPNEAAGLYFIAKCLRRRGDPAWRGYLLRALRRNPLHLKAWLSLVTRR